MPDLSKFLPLVDLVARAGDETSEFKAAKAAGHIQLILFLLGVVAMIVDCATNAFQGTHLGVWLGAAGTIIGAVSHTLTSNNYAAGQVAKKQKVVDLLRLVATSSDTLSSALTAAPAAAPAPAPAPAVAVAPVAAVAQK